jgi:hypothetical protein
MSRFLPLTCSEEGAWAEFRGAPATFWKRTLRVTVAVPPHSDGSTVERAIGELTERHDVFRTSYTTRGGVPVRSVLPHWDHEVHHGDDAMLAPASAGTELEPADLIRFLVQADATGSPRLVIDLNEMIADTWSCARLANELSVLLPAHAAGAASGLEPLPATYADFAVEQRRQMETGAYDRLIGYWLSVLRGAGAPPACLPEDGPDPSGDRAGEETHVLIEDLTLDLRSLAARWRLSPFMTVVALVQMALATRSGARDIVLGTTVSIRPPRWAAVQGNFANTILVRSVLTREPVFADVAPAVRRSVLGALAHQGLPDLVLGRALAEAGELARPDDWPVRVSYLANRTHAFAELDSRSPGESWSGDTDFFTRPVDIGFVEDGRGRLALWLSHDARRYTRQAMRDLVETLWTVLRRARAAASPGRP